MASLLLTGWIPTAAAEGLPAEKQNIDLIGFRQFQEVSRGFIKTTDQVRFKVETQTAKTITVVIPNALIPLKTNRLPMNTQYFESPVRLITTRVVEGPSPTTYIDIHLRQAATFQTSQKDNLIAIDFSR